MQGSGRSPDWRLSAWESAPPAACLDLGRLDEAASCFREVLGIWGAARADGAYERGHAIENLGRVYLATGSLTEAHRLHIVSGDLMGQAVALKDLGRAQRATGHEDQARESLAAQDNPEHPPVPLQDSAKTL